MWALALVGAQLIANPQQNDFRPRDLDFQTTVFRYIGELGNALQGHDRSPGRHFH
jgi:hypothetical protein